ncbi:MAG: stage II sporulation protein M [Planctomycetes bacterium]|nr:stage II sporulation protein M [Planctomycetota bacterium]
MDIDGFIGRNAERWGRLGALLDRLDARGPESLRAPELRELLDLYRAASSDLNEARTFTANPELLDTLSQLVGRAYKAIHAPPRPHRIGRLVRRFFARDFPLAVRRRRRPMAVAAPASALGTLFGFGATVADRRNAALLVPEAFFIERPAEHVAEREAAVAHDVSTAAGASAFYFTHNIRVSFLAFSLGLAAGLFASIYVFWTGGFLGALAAHFHIDGVAPFFYAWIGPHGALELPAIIIASASGIALGQAWLRPGGRTRRGSLRAALPDAARMMLGAASMLVLAGLLEGTISQFPGRVVPYAVKIGIACVLAGGLLWYLYGMRIAEEAGGATEGRGES